MTLSRELESRFTDYLEVNDIYSESTRVRAIRSLRYLSGFMEIENPGRDEVENFVRMARRKSNTNKTIENHLLALVHFNRMLGHEIWVPRQRKQETPQQYVATPEDVEKMLKYAREFPGRDYSTLLTAIFLTASSTGMRIGELARLNVEDVRPMDGGIFVRAEKREQKRIVGVPEEVLEYLQDYINGHRLKPSDRNDRGLFTWYHRERNKQVVKRYSADSLRNLIRERAEAAGCHGVNSHSLRRFAATELFRRGAEFRRVQFHLGHRDPKSTMRYVKMVDEIEARRNAELLRPFFQGHVKKEAMKVRMLAISELNSARGEGFEPSLS